MTERFEIEQQEPSRQDAARRKHDQRQAIDEINVQFIDRTERRQHITICLFRHFRPRGGIGPGLESRLFDERLPRPQPIGELPMKDAGQVGRPVKQMLVAWYDQLPIGLPHPRSSFDNRRREVESAIVDSMGRKAIADVQDVVVSFRTQFKRQRIARHVKRDHRGTVDHRLRVGRQGACRQPQGYLLRTPLETEDGAVPAFAACEPGLKPRALDDRRFGGRRFFEPGREGHLGAGQRTGQPQAYRLFPVLWQRFHIPTGISLLDPNVRRRNDRQFVRS